MLNIYKFQKYLGNSRKFILQNKKLKFWLLPNFIKEKFYQPKTFDVIFDDARGIDQTITQLATCNV